MPLPCGAIPRKATLPQILLDPNPTIWPTSAASLAKPRRLAFLTKALDLLEPSIKVAMCVSGLKQTTQETLCGSFVVAHGLIQLQPCGPTKAKSLIRAWKTTKPASASVERRENLASFTVQRDRFAVDPKKIENLT